MGNKSFYEGFFEKEIKLKNKPFMYRIILFILPISLCQNIIAQKTAYIDNRPQATFRLNALDEGIVLRYGDGINSCDIYGARKVIVNKDKGIYYLFYNRIDKDGWLACLAESKDLKTWV